MFLSCVKIALTTKLTVLCNLLPIKYISKLQKTFQLTPTTGVLSTMFIGTPQCTNKLSLKPCEIFSFGDHFRTGWAYQQVSYSNLKRSAVNNTTMVKLVD